MLMAFIDNKNTVIGASELHIVTKAFEILGYEVFLAKQFPCDKDRFLCFTECSALYQSPDIITSKPDMRTYETVAKLLEMECYTFVTLMTRFVDYVDKRGETDETKDKSSIDNSHDDRDVHSLGPSVPSSGDQSE